MRTDFAEARLADPRLREANAILRTCVHCGFCLATCPTYLLLGDELDSPRGRIYLAKTMLEQGKPATAPVVKHLDRCLTCLSCMTTCPSGVHYGHLVDARSRAHRADLQPAAAGPAAAAVRGDDRAASGAVPAGRARRPVRAGRSPGCCRGPLKSMIVTAPRRIGSPSWVDRPQVIPAEGTRRLRVALLAGCAQQVLRPEINEATVRVLTRHGCEVVIARGAGCCGAIMHQLAGRSAPGDGQGEHRAWSPLLGEPRRGRLQRVRLRRLAQGLRPPAGRRSRVGGAARGASRRSAAMLPRCCSSWALAGRRERPTGTSPSVTYHAACTMQHGLGLRTQSKQLLTQAGFTVREPAEAHICCGSAGTYSCCSRSCRSGCATASWRNSRRRTRRSSPPATSAASPTSPPPPGCRWCTRSNCSTGRPAARSRHNWHSAYG